MANIISIGDLKYLKKAGNGLSNTLLFKDKYVIKIKNPAREREVSITYFNHYNGYLIYNTFNKFETEFILLDTLHGINLAPRPIRYSHYYLVIEFIESKNCYEYIMTVPSVIENIIEKIEVLHHTGIYHGDLNLNNILIDKNHHIYFIDFESCFKPDIPEDIKKSLDYIIMLEKMHRFYPDVFHKYGDVFIKNICKVDKSFIKNIDKFKKWLNSEIITKIETWHE